MARAACRETCSGGSEGGWASKEAPPTRLKAPTAELRPRQKDQDTLPPYDELDRILEMLIEGETPIDEMVEAGFNRSLVLKVEKCFVWRSTKGVKPVRGARLRVDPSDGIDGIPLRTHLKWIRADLKCPAF